VGIRETKKQRTYDAISAAAVTLFLSRGFDRVSVAEIAAAAGISKPTLFKYFAAKEDLVLHRIADHQGESARVVRDRMGTETPLDALHRHFLDGLARRDPVTGLNDHPNVLAFHRMVFATPSLAQRLTAYVESDEAALASALTDLAGSDLIARLASAEIAAVQRILARENWRLLAAGRSADDLYPDAVAAANDGFALLGFGLNRFSATAETFGTGSAAL
jgi:AcrR family transcriptional regulator